MTHKPSKPDADALLEQAIDWMLRSEQAPDDVELRRELAAWLAADPGHAYAWQRARNVWNTMGGMEPDRSQWPAAVEAAERRPEPVAPPRRGVLKPLLTVAVAACLLVVLGPSLRLQLLADHQTGSGELREVSLPDGSRVHLSAESAIRTDYSDGERRVELLAGQAFFDVVRNAQRPFVVSADSMDVTVLGTSFDVQNASGLYAVSVQSGAVSVSYDGDLGHQLVPGQQLTLERRSGELRVDSIAPENVAAWREGRLFVHNRTVADVVEALDRFYPGSIFIADPALAQRRVTGSYDLRSPDLALRGLIQPYSGQVLELGGLLRIVRGS